MGVFEVGHSYAPGMHWQQDQYIGPAYDPSRDLSPTLPPSCDSSSMGDAGDPSGASGGSSCSTPSNNNHQSCASEMCRQQQPPGVVPLPLHRPPTPHSSFEHHIPKLESPSTPPSRPPASASAGVGLSDDGGGATHEVGGPAHCGGCGQRITDRFYLQAVDRRWHTACLQCCQCRRTLDGDLTCFSRDGNIYCKKDYYRLFGMKRCARCQATILSSELVMRAKHLVFHVHCFSCEACNALLTKGDQFGMRDGSVLCRLHFEMPTFPTAAAPPPHHHYVPPPFGAGGEFRPAHPGSVVPPPEAVAKVPPFFNGAPATPRQKGRPRKRKPKDLEDLTSDYLDMQFGRSPGGGSGTGLHGSGGQRTKRMRTSFKHHQLRTMKSYFAINHNPDAKDLKQLSQKTGLPKRVLQVWFQNARAKWRRMMLKQEGKSGEKCSGSESMSDMDMYPHGPASMGSTISMNPHSPFMMPQGSPSSMDCS